MQIIARTSAWSSITRMRGIAGSRFDSASTPTSSQSNLRQPSAGSCSPMSKEAVTSEFGLCPASRLESRTANFTFGRRPEPAKRNSSRTSDIGVKRLTSAVGKTHLIPVYRRRRMQAENDRSIFLSTMPATGRDRAIALAVVCISSVLFVCTVPFAGVPLRSEFRHSSASYQSALAIIDRDHRGPAVFAVRHLAVVGTAAAGQRLPVHRGRGDRSCPDLSGPVCSDGPFERRSADHGLALHDLARRISAVSCSAMPC